MCNSEWVPTIPLQSIIYKYYNIIKYIYIIIITFWLILSVTVTHHNSFETKYFFIIIYNRFSIEDWILLS